MKLLHGLAVVAGQIRLKMFILRDFPTLQRSAPRVGRQLDARVAGTAVISIGRRVRIGRRLTLRVLGNFEVGDNCFINNDAHICVHEKVWIGRNVRLGERVSIHDENHVFEGEELSPGDRSWDSYTTAPIAIGDNVWVGAGTIILGGVSIGSNSVIAAGSVVTKTIESGVLAAGVPARTLRYIK
jgi:maltose O-acetyltransferase